MNMVQNQSNRIQSVDLLRGIVMVVMTLDHVRDFFTNVSFNPTDLSQTNGFLFFTRWITHYCAPVFVFLAGISAFLYGSNGKKKTDLFIFLFTRGIWLVILEHTLVRYGWFFNWDLTFLVSQVMWAIGWSMVALSLLVFLPQTAVGIIGIIIICFHNLLDGVPPAYFQSLSWLWMILHSPGPIKFLPGYTMFIGYPILPWIGVIAAGYGAGSLYLIEQGKRKKILILLGAGMIILFFLLRYSNIYGDASKWAVQKSPEFTVFSFLNCTKYPPSLLYLLMTLGPALVLLAFVENAKGFFAQFFSIIGKVPMFYYLAHIFTIHILAVVYVYFLGGDPSYLFSNSPPWAITREYGVDLPSLYIIWIVVVTFLYFPSKWFAGIKRKYKHQAWLSYV